MHRHTKQFPDIFVRKYCRFLSIVTERSVSHQNNPGNFRNDVVEVVRYKNDTGSRPCDLLEALPEGMKRVQVETVCRVIENKCPGIVDERSPYKKPPGFPG